MPGLRSFAAALAAAFLLVIASPPLPAQGGGRGGGGEPPKNLQVLPKDTPRPQVVALMRTFALGLGVRCEHCHAPAPDTAAEPAGGRGGLPRLDYASDSLETKRVAREMLRMVMDINQKYLPATGRTVPARHQVSCETCHHGLARPRTLRAAMADAIDAAGADSAVALYRALREQYYGSAAYDFTESSLNEAAGEVARTPEQRPAALALLRLNLEFYPQSVRTLFTLANMSALTGDTAAAVDAVQKALAIDPDNPQLKAVLSRLKRPGR